MTHPGRNSAAKFVQFLAVLALFVTTAVVSAVRAAPTVPSDPWAIADEAIAAWDLAAAKAALASAPDGARRQVREGIIAAYEGEYTRAERILTNVLASSILHESERDHARAKQYLALARGSLRALQGGTTLRSADGLTEARFADPKDELLAPYLFDAMAAARQALAQEFDVEPDRVIRFEFLDDPAKLALVTPLTIENVRTTGTVGVTKYGRIVIITPRVMVFGYGWIDTAVHEYVHYLLTLRTRNRAPVWLQEGLAKLFEARWRREDPLPLDEPVANLLHRALQRDELVTFREMYPSIAMLPSQEKAALAYAEVETMLGLLRERGGRVAISALLDAVAAGEDAEQALAAAWGDTFESFMAEWKRVTTQRTAGKDAGELRRPQFGKSSEDEDAPADPSLLGDIFSHLGGGRARQHARLGQLLQLRGHDEAATEQYEKARAADRRARTDPELARRLGELYVRLERFAAAIPLLRLAAAGDPENANLAAAESRARLRGGDLDGARTAADRAIRNNPFIPTLHCDLAELATTPQRRAHEQALCPL